MQTMLQNQSLQLSIPSLSKIHQSLHYLPYQRRGGHPLYRKDTQNIRYHTPQTHHLHRRSYPAATPEIRQKLRSR